MNKTIYMLGYASDVAGANRGSNQGPLVMEQSHYLSMLNQSGVDIHWQEQIKPKSFSLETKLAAIENLCTTLGFATNQLIRENKFFTVIGGDHSCAIGTWSGVHAALRQQGDLGLIWIDAHMDSHTFKTTPSGNIHGMPLACLLGYGEPGLIHLFGQSTKLKPEHVCLIGVRSFEEGEAKLLKSLNVRIFFMDEIKERGMEAVMAEALEIVTKGTAGFGVTIDIDAIDPQDAPGTGTAEEGGILADELCEALRMVSKYNNFIGAEIAEFDPLRDQNEKTEKLIVQMLAAMTTGTENYDFFEGECCGTKNVCL